MRSKFVFFALLALALQVLVFNGMAHFVRYIPYLGFWGVIFFPYRHRPVFYLVWSFLIGLVMDLSMGTGGVFAASALTFAFIRGLILRFFQREDTPYLRITGFGEWTGYLALSALTLTSAVYFFDGLSLRSVAAQVEHVLLHAAANTFVYLIYTFLFFWDLNPDDGL
ncbi:MAG: hypothetical protein GXO27_03395 [Chlorobi bacterium]|nr:hypothetical protein [Chlorobiota bacterium]